MKKLILIFILLPFLAFSQQKEETKKKKKVNYAFIPLIMYNSSLGGQIGFMTSGYFDVSKKDTISPASNIGVVSNYYTSKSYMGVLFSKFYLKEDNYRIKTAIGGANINFQTYVEIPEMPTFTSENEDGTFIDYNTKFYFIYLEGMKKIWNHFYLGARVMYNSSITEFDKEGVPSEEEHLFGFGIASEYDNRDNVFYPSKGQNAKIGSFTFLEELGSTSQYHKVKIEYNKYFSLNSNTILLARAFGVSSFGDVPFSGKNVVGRDDMRGYSNGKFRANQVYDLQTELRWNFYKKWGMVAFGGVAVATDDFSGTNYSGLLPAIGVGLRFKAIKSKNINIGIDVAKGVDDWGVYFRIGETFTR